MQIIIVQVSFTIGPYRVHSAERSGAHVRRGFEKTRGFSNARSVSARMRMADLLGAGGSARAEIKLFKNKVVKKKAVRIIFECSEMGFDVWNIYSC